MTLILPPVPNPAPPLPDVHDEYNNQVYTHSSVRSSNATIPYDRLTCLGDTYLTAAVTHILFEHPDILAPGEITEIRKVFVSNATAASWGRAYGFEAKVVVAQHMLPLPEDCRERITGDTFKAYLGAIVKSSSVQELISFLEPFIVDSFDSVRKQVQAPPRTADRNAVQRLHDRLLRLDIPLPEYIYEDHGEKGQPRFLAKCVIKGNKVGTGNDRNKQDAKRQAAAQACRMTERQLTALKEK
jgi:ribonuclease-3